MDLKLLDKKIRDSGIFRYAICKAIGISRQELWNKMHGKSKFSERQFSILAKTIGLHGYEVKEILHGEKLR